MDESRQTWHLERDAPVRADAEGLFIPVSGVEGAAIGDVVVVVGREGGEQRSGRIVETAERDGELFFRLELED